MEGSTWLPRQREKQIKNRAVPAAQERCRRARSRCASCACTSPGARARPEMPPAKSGQRRLQGKRTKRGHAFFCVTPIQLKKKKNLHKEEGLKKLMGEANPKVKGSGLKGSQEVCTVR